MLIEFHRNMLVDRVRNEAFYQALKKAIKKGETDIADLGSGTGFLAFVASKLGARNIYLYESADIMALSQALAKANKITNCHFFHEHSTAVMDAPMVDLVVSETLGNYVFEEHIIQNIEDAKRFLKPGGKIIPEKIEQFVAPVVNDRFLKDFTKWDDVGFGLDYGIAREMSLNNIYVRTFKAKDLMDNGKSAAIWDSLDFYKKNKSTRQGEVSWKINKATEISGFALWWDSELIKGVRLSTSPMAKKTHWEQLYFPVLEKIKAAKGDVLSIKIKSESSYEEGTNLEWVITLKKSGGKTIKQSLDLRNGYIG